MKDRLTGCVVFFAVILTSSGLALTRASTQVSSRRDGASTAIDPSIQGNLGPATNQVLPRRMNLDPVVSGNKLVNDRTLCPDGRGLTQSETSIAVSGNVVVAAFNDSRGRCDPDNHTLVGWAFSLDNGETWTDGGGLPSGENVNAGDPWVGVSPDGSTFYLSGLGFSGGIHGVGFYRGTVSRTGIEWSAPTVITLPGTIPDKEAFVVDPNSGTLYLTYTRFVTFTPEGIYCTRSDDGGLTWSDHLPVYQGVSQGSFPAVDNRGNLYVAYQVSSNMHVSKSVDGGITFANVATFPYATEAVTFVDSSRDFPQLAVDLSGGNRDGWVYLVWHHRPQAGQIRPYISHSEDGGATWSEPISVSSDNTVSFQWFPSVTVGSDGSVNVIYLDRRNNPGTGLTDLFLSHSTDGGNTFIDMQVTDVTSSWEGIRYDPGITFAGDYIRVVSSGSNAYAAWADPRNGDPDVYFARIDSAALSARATLSSIR